MSKRNEIEPGDVLIDASKREWVLGDILGKGGFGYIYTARLCSEEEFDKYVIKIEPKSNGPLFVEQVFYQRVGKTDMVTDWCKKNNLPYLGIPSFHGFGFYTKNKKDYRFIIIDRLGCDLYNILQYNNYTLPLKTVCLIAIKIIVVLKYLHEHGYAHSDIKASNIAIGARDKNKIYLLDYGLSYRFMVDGRHVLYKRDPKKMHNGTIEFTSTDMHNGACPSRRGDLETLGYCLIKWLGGTLPWEDNLKNCKYVMESKIKFLNDIKQGIETSLSACVEPLRRYFLYVKSLAYEQRPDYDLLIQLLTKA
ncbi:m142R [Myxoma virus]|uniref:M142R n=2 Tax=Myxoma virus TaxID=10273 RepID=Q9Q8G1_MYXVL|nr:m142R [Myxoma virus]ACB28937.1 m142R [recombinant virus 6918VP60-T2]AAF15030.1 m142R [Myxoma virus]ACB28765.1 m142R [Myxoma virus]AFU77074.1 m142R [Myxoma virus]AFU77241.1 m142R [Myxoma virus]